MGKEGEFVFHGVTPGRYTISFTYASGESYHQVTVAPGESRKDILVSPSDASEAEARVSGQVFGLREGETARAELYPAGLALVQSDGSYEMDVPKIFVSPTWVTLTTSRGREVRKSISIGEGEDALLDFDLRDANLLFGRVTRHGVPVRGVAVYAYLLNRKMGESRQFESMDVTSSIGEFQISGLSRGQHQVSIKGRQMMIDVSGRTRLNVDLCRDPTEADLIYMKDEEVVCDDHVVSGRVISAGRGLANASLALVNERMAPRFASSDSRGRFHFRHLVPGEYKVAVYRHGYEVAVSKVDASARGRNRAEDLDVEFSVSALDWIPISMVDKESGLPLDFTIVEVRDDHGTLWWLPMSAGPTGQTRLPPFLYGRTFTLRHPNYNPIRVVGWSGQDISVGFSSCFSSSGDDCLTWSWQEPQWKWPYMNARYQEK